MPLAPIPMALLSAEASVLAVNESFCQLVGRPAAAIERLPWQALIEPEQRGPIAALLQQLLAGEQPSLQQPTRLLQADGQPLAALMQASYLRSGNGSQLIVQLLPPTHPLSQQQQAMAELEQERSLLHTVLSHIDALVYMKDHEGRYHYANPAAASRLNPGGDGVQGLRDADLLPAEIVASIRQVDEQVFRLGAPCCYEQNLPDQAGPARVCLTQKLLYSQPGQPDRLIGFSTDITELRRATKQLTASEEHFRLLAANATDVVVRLSDEGLILWVSPSLTAALGWQPDEWIGHQGTEFLMHGGKTDTYCANMAILRAGGCTRARDQVRASDGSIHWVETLASPYRNASGRLDGIVAGFRTIDQQVATEQQLQKLATTDGLTGIANRRHLEVLIGQAIHRADRYGEALCLILCDVDHFKAINDRHGHHCGDQVLIAFTARIQQQLRSSDAFGRWGGEEFLILVPHSSAAAALCMARKLCQLVAASPFPQAGRVTASFGVAQRLPQEAEEAWLQRVDAALYAAKAAGRNCVRGA
jgi:diguanylate cyclase (GGDEF)-like protein/PAS domain S-box-containing protein